MFGTHQQVRVIDNFSVRILWGKVNTFPLDRAAPRLNLPPPINKFILAGINIRDLWSVQELKRAVIPSNA